MSHLELLIYVPFDLGAYSVLHHRIACLVSTPTLYCASVNYLYTRTLVYLRYLAHWTLFYANSSIYSTSHLQYLVESLSCLRIFVHAANSLLFGFESVNDLVNRLCNQFPVDQVPPGPVLLLMAKMAVEWANSGTVGHLLSMPEELLLTIPQTSTENNA
ncbi:unnamed protein product [Protopolystoma xenopodis]|uniref:Uncharacterized protein n=1 Tax=Protopolystoma xenopodis TaxID=117903 RepID=A0A448WUZ1_9PLAT|nr:unnamed protein product [Protopolystoma xenopodis]